MFILEGNIGAGKSTFLQMLAQQIPHIDVALEPVHDWQKNVYGQSLLANFYQDPHRWTYSIETFTMMCRVKEHIKDQEDVNVNRVIERSIYSGHYCFAYTGHENGCFTAMEWKLYEEWFNFLIPQKCRLPRGFIYLRTEPGIAFKRIKKRNRLAEKKITYAYLKQMHSYHEKFLITKEHVLPTLEDVPVLVLNGDRDFEIDPIVMKGHIDQIQDFMLCLAPVRQTGMQATI